LNFFYRFSKNTHILNLMKIRPVGTELFRADGQADMIKQIVAFLIVTKAPNNTLKKTPSFLNWNGSVTSLNIRSLSLGQTG
jgi:hypothetical protein